MAKNLMVIFRPALIAHPSHEMSRAVVHLAGVFTVIGLVVLFIAIVTNAVCRHCAKKLDRKISEAAADAYPVESVSVVCADAKSNPANAQLHMYGKNTSTVLVTNEMTVNGAIGS
ncbi:hypothetical protein BD311DRAFT_811039 [Dichomitus squalens]|uniref:Uncharacterized protein n=1 Tax=Dichomitus squalens TaxID=114155 RepID=A0A4Q9MAT8_9APHY|nr:hypothetical protein BD311DRAFT_811039 [Dichomitus squalens]